MKSLTQRIEEELRIFQHQGADHSPISKLLAECLEMLQHHDRHIVEVIQAANKNLERARRAEYRVRDLEAQAAARSDADALAKHLYRQQTGQEPIDHADLCSFMMKVLDMITDAELTRNEREAAQ